MANQEPMPAPHQGPAQEPSRTATIDDVPTYKAPPQIETLPLDPTTEPSRQIEAPLEAPVSLETTPPPEDPEKAVKQSTSETRIGELTRALGEQKKDFEQKLEEMALRYESQLAALVSQAGAATPPAAGQLPPNVDPEAQMTVGQFVQAMDKMWPYMQEQLIRSQWDVTPEEEQAVLQSNPHIAKIADGMQRAEFVRKAVTLARKRKGESQGEPTATTPAPGKSGSKQTRTHERTVPHVEASTTPAAPDLVPDSPTEQILSEYEKAKTISDPKKRVAAMKAAFKKAQAAAGLSDEVFSKMAFVQKASNE